MAKDGPRLTRLTFALGMGALSGCLPVPVRPEAEGVVRASHAEHPAHHARPPAALPELPAAPMALPIREDATQGAIAGKADIEACIQRALSVNPTIRAAMADIEAWQARVPQAESLADPMVQTTIWPFPSNGPQYSLMGYMPYDMMISQQFPWVGTLRLRGEAARHEVNAAAAALVAAQLDVVTEVKTAYWDLYSAEQSLKILEDNAKLADEVIELARARVRAGAPQRDLIASQIAARELEQQRIDMRRAVAEARAELSRALHQPPELELSTASSPPADLPDQVERLYALAAAVRPELQARLATIAKAETDIALAEKKFKPDITLGVNYGLMTRQNAMSTMADGRDNIGLTVGFNLPIYRNRLNAALAEAHARAKAERLRYEVDRDLIVREIKAKFAQVQSRRESIDLLTGDILPRAKDDMKLSAAAYRGGNVDATTLNSARQLVFRTELQIARERAELGKFLGGLERAVGTAWVASAREAPGQAAPIPPPAPPKPEDDAKPEGEDPDDREGERNEEGGVGEGHEEGKEAEAKPAGEGIKEAGGDKPGDGGAGEGGEGGAHESHVGVEPLPPL